MNNKMIRAIGAGVLVALWLTLTGFAWFAPAKDMSEAERRPLDQMPEITWESIVDGKFMPDFESYTLDQFPLRDTFRQIKSLFHYYAMQQSDNNDIYVVDGYAAKMEYPLSTEDLDYALSRFAFVYDKYLKDSGSKVYTAIVPDKGLYLADAHGYLSMDYAAMYNAFEEKMPWATQIDLRGDLNHQSYYYTDTHWRQEHLLPAAETICNALGVTPYDPDSFIKTAIDRPFYGVYYGQAALPMDPETMYIMENAILAQCRVHDVEKGTYNDIYDMNMLTSKDQYDIFLSGANKSLLVIENPNASTDRELIVFRDSFGSSMIPLLTRDYAKVIVVDIRYMAPEMLGRNLEQLGLGFQDRDVLFLYSTLVLNTAKGNIK